VSGRLGLYAYASEHGLARATQTKKKDTRERPLS
jgi:hypothetical protein